MAHSRVQRLVVPVFNVQKPGDPRAASIITRKRAAARIAIAIAPSMVVRCPRNALEDALRYIGEAYHGTEGGSLAARIAQIAGCSTASSSLCASVLREPARSALAYCEGQHIGLQPQSSMASTALKSRSVARAEV